MMKTGKAQKFIIVSIGFIFIMMFFTPAQSYETEGNSNYFDSLQEKLVNDGFDEYEIKALYIRPEVSFETKCVSLFFMHSESRLDYDQYMVKQQIKKARRYMST